MEWTSPSMALGLLPLVLLCGVLVWRGRAAVAGTRLVLGLLLLGALADPSLSQPNEPSRVVFLVDTSASIPELVQDRIWSRVEAFRADLPTDSRWGLVQVDGEARTLATPGPAIRPLPEPLPASESVHTAMREGIQQAAALLPNGQAGRIVLWTDGQFDPSPLATDLDALAARGITVEVERPDIPTAPADLRRLVLPEVADVGSTASGTLTVWGGPRGLSTTAELELIAADGSTTPLEPIPLDVGAEQRIEVPVDLSLESTLPAGLYAVRCTLPDSDRDPLIAGLRVERPPRVLLVRGDRRDGAVIEGILRAEGLEVDVARARTPPTLDDTTDLVILAGTPTGAGGLPAAWVSALSDFVEQGGGLLTVSGPGGYASGGWQDSALARILPVRIDPDGAEKDDSAALLVVLDKSGSMARPAADARTAAGMVAGVTDLMVGGRSRGSKIQVAAEAAAATMDRLRDHDRIGVLAVDTLPYWPVPMTDATAREDAKDKLRRISAGGGGMYVLTALDAAAAALRKEEAPLRHMLLLVDASDAGEQSQDSYGNVRGALDLARELRSEGITISVVGLGSDTSRDSPFLEDLTQTGGGRLKLTPDIRTVSALFTQEVERLVGSAVHEQAPIRLDVKGWHPSMQGVDFRRAPQVWGWSDVLPRTRARTLLATPEGTPVFAIWQRGLGQVAAWTSDDGARWARGWPAWSGSAVFWTQLARTLARDGDDTHAPLRIDTSAPSARLTITSTDDLGQPQLVGTPDLTVEYDGVPAPVPNLDLVAPGRLQTTIAAPPGTRLSTTATLQTATGTSITTTAEAIVPTSSERDGFGLQPEVLDALVRKGAAVDEGEQSRVALWPWLALAALLLLPLDAYARRFRSGTPSRS